MKFIGYHDERTLPVRRGDLVTIRKGTLVTSVAGGTKPAKRTYRVRVDHVLPGMTFTELTARGEWGERPGPQKNPSVCWAGAGGYWHEADINDIPEAQG